MILSASCIPLFILHFHFIFIQKGEFTFISVSEDKRTQMASYYSYFTSVEHLDQPVVTVPYIDFSDLGKKNAVVIWKYVFFYFSFQQEDITLVHIFYDNISCSFKKTRVMSVDKLTCNYHTPLPLLAGCILLWIDIFSERNPSYSNIWFGFVQVTFSRCAFPSPAIASIKTGLPVLPVPLPAPLNLLAPVALTWLFAILRTNSSISKEVAMPMCLWSITLVGQYCILCCPFPDWIPGPIHFLWIFSILSQMPRRPGYWRAWKREFPKIIYYYHFM